MNISFARGDSFIKGFQLRNESTKEPITQDFDEIYFTMKKNYSRNEYVLQKTLSGGGIVADGDGHYTLTLLPGDTAALPFGEYDFDIELDRGDFVRTFCGKITLTKESTHATNK